MNKTLTLYILASLVFVAVSYAGEPGPALTQLENLSPGEEFWPGTHPQFPMPDPSTYQPSDSHWMTWQKPGGSTEDCSMQDGVEVCIAPNWPSCDMNGDVEPCIDHVQTLCQGDTIPAWVSFAGNGRRYQGCFYPAVYYAETADKALLLRAGEKSLSVLLRGRKVVFALGAVKKNSSRGSAAGFSSSLQEFLENDPCHGLMACYNQANAEFTQHILSSPSGNAHAQWSAADTVAVGQPAAAPGR